MGGWVIRSLTDGRSVDKIEVGLTGRESLG